MAIIDIINEKVQHQTNHGVVVSNIREALIELANVETTTISKVTFNKSSQTNSAEATFDLDMSEYNIISFVADSNVSLGFTGATVGTYIMIIDSGAFTVDLQAASGWQSQLGAQPTITSKTILTGIYDGTNMIVVSTDDIQDI